MWSRENIPLAVMSAASAAILLFFAVSESAMPGSPRQLGGCGGSEDAAIAPAWNRAELIPKNSWNPAFPRLPPSRPADRVGCMRSGTTVIG
jgi:hypothetical protein